MPRKRQINFSIDDDLDAAIDDEMERRSIGSRSAMITEILQAYFDNDGAITSREIERLIGVSNELCGDLEKKETELKAMAFTIAEKDKELDDLRKMIDLTAREKDARISDLKEQLGFLQLQYGMLNDRMLTITNRLLPEGSTKKRWQFWKRRQPQIVTEGR